MERTKQIIKVSYKGIMLNLVLTILKGFVGSNANSISVILDAVNNLSDALSSIITIVGIKLSKKKADKKHPYGYGRVEYITSAIISFIIILAGVTALKESIEKFLHHEELNYNNTFIIIIIACVIAKFLLGMHYIKKGKILNSDSLYASGTEAIFDSFISLATLISAAINIIFGINIEGILGTLISILMLRAGLEIMIETIHNIIGVKIDEKLSKDIKEMINSYPQVKGAYDFLFINYGPESNFGSIHIELDDDMTVKEIDSLTRQIVSDVYDKFEVKLTIGVFATNTYNKTTKNIKDAVNKEISNYPQIFQMHGFHVDEDKKQACFDVICNFKEINGMNIVDNIKNNLNKKYPDYKFLIKLDKDFND